MIKASEALKREVNQVVQGINLIKSIKKTLTFELEKSIESSKVEKFLKESDIEIFNKEEQVHLFKSLYKVFNDEKFNPINLTENSSKKQNVLTGENGEKIKVSKDIIPELYYNFEHKVDFSNQYGVETRRVIMALFRSTAKAEILYNRDLYEFDLDELKYLLKSLKAKTLRSLQNTVSTIERYIEFSKSKQEYKINYASAFDSKEKLEDLLDEQAEENMIFDKDEIMDLALNSDNPQDGVILGLIFDGLSHKNEFEELTNLTKDDIDFENKLIKLEDRVVPMSHETKMLVQDALEQDRVYISITGETSRKYKIAEGVNVIRGLRGRAKVKGQIISQRILRIAEIFGHEYLNATSISYSGQLHFAKTLIEDGKMSVDEAIPLVLERFGIPNNSSSHFYLKNRIDKFIKI